MQVYLVGGAVRDQLLGNAIKDKDWVVVGASKEAMEKKGFVSVGKDFPVFLHPDSKEEYALARVEKKVGSGYHGFSFDVSSKVSLVEDLQRRDLTINAIAMDSNNQIIDPYDGCCDIKNKILKHVSPAFVEDPVRVLRVARFSAKFPDFTIAPATKKLMLNMRESGELDSLVAERVWQELIKALDTSMPVRFFQVLADLEILGSVTKIWQKPPAFSDCLPSFASFSIMQKFWWCCLGADLQAVDFGIEYFKIPKAWRKPAVWSAEKRWLFQENSSRELVLMANYYDLWRQFDKFEAWLDICQHHPDVGDRAIWPQLKLLYKSSKRKEKIWIAELLKQKITGKELGCALFEKRVALAKQILLNDDFSL